MDHLDWSQVRSLVAVAEAGSLSRAARTTGISQPTLGRHIDGLEGSLGVSLFTRSTGGFELTETGADLLDHARAMAAAADRLQLTAAGHEQAISGTVRITASEIVATYVLPDVLAALRKAERSIDIEVVASNQTDNLLRREADIAVRMYRPRQADVFIRKVGELPIGMYATPDYIARRGAPVHLADMLDHDVVGYDRDDRIIEGFRGFGLEVDRSFFAFRSDDQVVAWKMIVAGFGLGFNQTIIGEAEPRVQRLMTDVDLPSMPIWLAAHNELKTSRRVRRVFDFLAERLTAICKSAPV